MLRTQSIPQKNPASASRTVEGQAVIALSDRAVIHIINDVGTRVWNLIDGKRSVEEIAADVRRQLVESGYEGIPADVEADIQDFFQDVHAKGMITMEEAAG